MKTLAPRSAALAAALLAFATPVFAQDMTFTLNNETGDALEDRVDICALDSCTLQWNGLRCAFRPSHPAPRRKTARPPPGGLAMRPASAGFICSEISCGGEARMRRGGAKPPPR